MGLGACCMGHEVTGCLCSARYCVAQTGEAFMVALTSSLGKAFAGNTVSRETKGRISGIYLSLFSLHTQPRV